MNRRLLPLSILVFAAACGRPPERVAFDRAYMASERLAMRGRPAAAARALEALAPRSYLEDDKVNLRVLAARYYREAGLPADALRVLRATGRENRDYEETARVRLELARLLISPLGHPGQAAARLQELIVAFPSTAAARLALHDLSNLLSGPGYDLRWLQLLTRLRQRLGARPLGLAVDLYRARALLALGHRAEGLRLLMLLHHRHPHSAVWTPATVELAEGLRAAGAHAQEAEVLERLVATFEGTVGSAPGSYDAPMYTRGEIRLGALYCGPLERPDKGIAWLEDFPSRHPGSSRKDDALWQLAVCYRVAGDLARSRAALCALVHEHGITRHARRARAALGLPAGPGPGGSGGPPAGPDCAPASPGTRP